MRRWIIVLFAITFALAVQAGPITYQGQLQDDGSPANTQVDLVFEIYELDKGGSPIATDIHDDVVVSDGLFQVELDFGSGSFDGSERWLEVIVDGQELTPRQRITAAPVAVHALNVPTDNLEDDFWRQGGNAGTDPASDFLGTTDNTPFEIRTGNQRALRLEPADDPDAAPNWIGGHASNMLEPGTVGVTISGGGGDGGAHSVEADYVTIGGGASHTATESFAAIGGGVGNTASGLLATVGAGGQNTAAGNLATVAGGQENTAEGPWATVAGGRENTAQINSSTVGGGQFSTASGFASTVPGGSHNEATGAYSLAAGRRAKAEHDGAFVWADSTDADFASIGADQFLVRAGGGVNHVVGIGGWRIEPALIPNVIGGWEGNIVGTDVKGATIGGGGCPVGKSPCNIESPNEVTSNFGTVGGGYDNTVSGSSATIGGGRRNTADGQWSTVGGGGSNTADEIYATVGGGQSNTAGGDMATVPGGQLNEASGGFSFAAGRRAKAVHGGAFVWADGTFADFASTGLNQFLIRAGGGVGINTNDPNGFDLAVDGSAAKPGGGSWSNFSDARLKQNIEPVSAVSGSLLDRLLELNAYSFEYTEEAVDTRLGLPGKQIGLLAQEVREVFPEWVDTDEEGYLYVTERGTTAIMVEALRELSDKHDQQMAELRDQNAELRAQVASLTMQTETMSQMAKHNTELEDRLAALEALLLEGRQIAVSQQ